MAKRKKQQTWSQLAEISCRGIGNKTPGFHTMGRWKGVLFFFFIWGFTLVFLETHQCYFYDEQHWFQTNNSEQWPNVSLSCILWILDATLFTHDFLLKLIVKVFWIETKFYLYFFEFILGYFFYHVFLKWSVMSFLLLSYKQMLTYQDAVLTNPAAAALALVYLHCLSLAHDLYFDTKTQVQCTCLFCCSGQKFI